MGCSTRLPILRDTLHEKPDDDDIDQAVSALTSLIQYRPSDTRILLPTPTLHEWQSILYVLSPEVSIRSNVTALLDVSDREYNPFLSTCINSD